MSVCRTTWVAHSDAKTLDVKTGPHPGFDDLSEFGAAIGWGTGNADALARAEELTAEELERIGVTSDLASQWADFYDTITQLFPQNPSAPGRAFLMRTAADKLNCP
jgi:hypothetical protein